MSDIKAAGTVNYLRELYYAAADTLELQSAILETLVGQQTANAYATVRTILTTEPPVLEFDNTSYAERNLESIQLAESYRYNRRNFLSELDDSLLLLKQIMPDILPLANLDDYKPAVLGLLATLIDSNMIKLKVYSSYFPKFILELKALPQTPKSKAKHRESQLTSPRRNATP
ncbi:MAG: hypothetical protein EOP49_27715 [Sphingobacteriales bacterium]|nr:MAG: hypothetical protein EOP49_27715 [Sphingobacteriales bacterium]